MLYQKSIQVRLQNQLIPAGLEPILSRTEKSWIALYYRQLSTNIKIKILKLIPVLLARALGPWGITNWFYFIILHFNIRG